MTRAKAIDRAQKFQARLNAAGVPAPERKVAERNLRRLRKSWNITDDELKPTVETSELKIGTPGEKAPWKGTILAVCGIPYETKTWYNPDKMVGYIEGSPLDVLDTRIAYEYVMRELQQGYERYCREVRSFGHPDAGRFFLRSPRALDWFMSAAALLRERFKLLRDQRRAARRRPPLALITENPPPGWRVDAAPAPEEWQHGPAKAKADEFEPLDAALDFAEQLRWPPPPMPGLVPR